MEKLTRRNIIRWLKDLGKAFGTGPPFFTNEKVLDQVNCMSGTEIEP